MDDDLMDYDGKFCIHCGRGEWNPKTGTREQLFWIAQDETANGIEIMRNGIVIADVIYLGGSDNVTPLRIRVHLKSAHSIAVVLRKWLAIEFHPVFLDKTY